MAVCYCSTVALSILRDFHGTGSVKTTDRPFHDFYALGQTENL